MQGIYYFVSHPFLYPLLRARLLPGVLLSLFVLSNLFFWYHRLLLDLVSLLLTASSRTFLPQFLFLSIFHGLGAWVNTTFLVLGEGSVIVALLFEAFFVDETQVDVFDAVLINEGCRDLLAPFRVLDPEAPNPVKELGRPTIRTEYSPFSFRQIAELILFLPLNLIPVVGTPLFLFMTGYRAGPFQHWRYLKLMGFDKKERKAFIKKRQLQYTWFGTVALILQLVPVLSMFFLLTTAAGSALWAARMEAERKQIENANGIPEVDPPPAYTDEPDAV